MNVKDPIGKKSIEELTRKPAEPEGRTSSHGKHPEFSLNVVKENRDEVGVLYGLMVSAPYFNPSKGIQWVFEGWYIEEWDKPQDGVFLVTITGHNLQDISNHLKDSTLDRLVLGENVTGFDVKKIGGDKPGKK